MSWKLLLVLVGVLSAGVTARAEEVSVRDEQTGVEELNPFAPGVEDYLNNFDLENGVPAVTDALDGLNSLTGCYQQDCAVFVEVDKGSQTLSLYVNGRYADRWAVSTGIPGHGTPDFNQRFNGRIYERFSSTTYPGGDYMGLGNMPYAMFISGGFAIHGTPQANWRHLGRPASHGCIRVHPDHARYLNRLLRQVGVKNSWVLVH